MATVCVEAVINPAAQRVWESDGIRALLGTDVIPPGRMVTERDGPVSMPNLHIAITSHRNVP
jgi:hypothetical protein